MEGKPPLTAQISKELDPELIRFFTTYVESFITWELLLFFQHNPHTFDTAEGIARYIGRTQQDVERALRNLAQRGVLRQDALRDLQVYALDPKPEIRPLLAKFMEATQSPEFRRRAIYHLVRS